MRRISVSPKFLHLDRVHVQGPELVERADAGDLLVFQLAVRKLDPVAFEVLANLGVHSYVID